MFQCDGSQRRLDGGGGQSAYRGACLLWKPLDGHCKASAGEVRETADFFPFAAAPVKVIFVGSRHWRREWLRSCDVMFAVPS